MAGSPKIPLKDKPGLNNWIDKAGGLPRYIKSIAEHIKGENPSWDDGRCIASAVNRVKKWAKGGDNVKPDTRAKAQAALADWERKKNLGAAADADLKLAATVLAEDFDEDAYRLALSAAREERGIEQEDLDLALADGDAEIDEGRFMLAIQHERATRGIPLAGLTEARLDLSLGDDDTLSMGIINFDPAEHPRDLKGQFRKTIGGLSVGESAKLPDGTTVRSLDGGYKIGDTKVTSAREAADTALNRSAKSDDPRSVGGAKKYANASQVETTAQLDKQADKDLKDVPASQKGTSQKSDKPKSKAERGTSKDGEPGTVPAAKPTESAAKKLRRDDLAEAMAESNPYGPGWDEDQSTRELINDDAIAAAQKGDRDALAKALSDTDDYGPGYDEEPQTYLDQADGILGKLQGRNVEVTRGGFVDRDAKKAEPPKFKKEDLDADIEDLQKKIAKKREKGEKVGKLREELDELKRLRDSDDSPKDEAFKIVQSKNGSGAPEGQWTQHSSGDLEIEMPDNGPTARIQQSEIGGRNKWTANAFASGDAVKPGDTRHDFDSAEDARKWVESRIEAGDIEADPEPDEDIDKGEGADEDTAPEIPAKVSDEEVFASVTRAVDRMVDGGDEGFSGAADEIRDIYRGILDPATLQQSGMGWEVETILEEIAQATERSMNPDDDRLYKWASKKLEEILAAED